MDTVTRLSKLSPEDIKQLQEISKQGYLTEGGSFWLSIEKALEEKDPDLELHKCGCGGIIFSSREYIEDCKKKAKQKTDTCWHKYGLIDSMSVLNSDMKRRVNDIILLTKTNRNFAYIRAKGLLPTDDPDNFDYSLYRLEFALSCQNYTLKSKADKKQDFMYQSLQEFSKLFDKVKKINKTEYKKIIDFYTNKDNMIDIINKFNTAYSKVHEADNVLADEAYKRITKRFSPSFRGFGNSKKNALILHYNLKMDAYQAYFEITWFLELLYNLIIVANGGNFTPSPFSRKRLITGEDVGTSKAFMVRKIIEESNYKELNKKIDKAYDNILRNGTSGHNDYSIDIEKMILTIKKNNVKYSINKINEIVVRLTSITHVILNLINVEKYQDRHAEFSLQGIMSLMRARINNKYLLGLQACQFWSNCDIDKKGENIKVLNLKISKDRKYIMFSHSEKMPKNPFKFAPTKKFLELLTDIQNLDNIHYDRTIIAPRIQYFLNAAKREMNVMGEDYFVVGDTHFSLKINKSGIKKIIKLLKNKNLPDDTPTPIPQVIKPLKAYTNIRVDGQFKKPLNT